MEKKGHIVPHELRFFLSHWGITVSDEEFKKLFDKFDLDKDGVLSYKDFQKMAGRDILPDEFQYFRWDKAHSLRT